MSDTTFRLARLGEDAAIIDFINANFDMRLPLLNRPELYHHYYAGRGGVPQFAVAEQDGEYVSAAGYILANTKRRPDIWVSVWVGDMVGVDYLYNFVHDTLECSYISAENDMDLGPLVLGSQSSGLTVVQLAGAYTMFNTGTFTTPHYYTEITDYQGNMILDNNKYINTTQAISADTAYIMNRMMWNVLHSRKGTAYGKAPDGEMDSVAKTGTTSNYKDYTFAGLTPYYVTAIWWGCDRPTEMDTLGKAGRNASPIQYAWKALMEDLQADLPVKEFAKGENVVEKHFDTSTGAIISGGGSVGYYTEDNLPDNSYTVSEDDPYAALAQAAADAAAAAGDTTTEPTE